MARTFEQFIRFTTDSVGIERTLRLFQAITQILSSYTVLFNLLIYLLTLTAEKPPSPDTTYAVLLALRRRFGLIRRFFRLFRFLESFHSAHKLYLGASGSTIPRSGSGSGSEKGAPPPGLQTEDWLDVVGRTFNGMYLLAEASLVADAMEIEGLALWAPAAARRLGLEAQRFWLLSLACGVLAGLLRAAKVLAYAPVPAAGEQFSHAAGEEGEVEVEVEVEVKEKDGEGEGEGWDLKKEQARLRDIARDRKKARALWRGEIQAKIRRLMRGVVANALDIALPGTAVGLIELEPGAVGVAMFVTSILTGLDVWERCGREVELKK